MGADERWFPVPRYAFSGKVVSAMFFVDSYERQLDDRGRIILPAKVREAVGREVYITRSPSEKCLHLYTAEEWEVLSMDKLLDTEFIVHHLSELT